MSQNQQQPGIALFYIKYSKLITIVCIGLLIYFPIDIYFNQTFSPGHTLRTIGGLLNDFVTYFAVPLGSLIYMRKLNKEHNKCIAIIDAKLDDKYALIKYYPIE